MIVLPHNFYKKAQFLFYSTTDSPDSRCNFLLKAGSADLHNSKIQRKNNFLWISYECYIKLSAAETAGLEIGQNTDNIHNRYHLVKQEMPLIQLDFQHT